MLRQLLHPHRRLEELVEAPEPVLEVTAPVLTAPRLFSPYAGFSIDRFNVVHMDASENYVRSVETRAIGRNLNYKEQLALRLWSRILFGRIRKIFTLWRRHCFRYIFLRRQLLKCHLMKFLARRFSEWRRITLREALLRKIIRRYWRRHRYIRFLRWKLNSRWQGLKQRLQRLGFKHMLIHLAYQRRLNMRWFRVSNMYQRIISSLVLQRAQRRHSKRRRYWANRVIKRYFMCWFGIRLVEERKRGERQRITLELVLKTFYNT
jgi:hypothetical protein